MEGETETIEVTFVLPVYNCAGNLIPLFNELEIIAETFKQYHSHYVFVDDASTDTSWKELNSLPSKKVELILLKKNIGSYAAVCEGLKAVRGDRIVVMAADGQDDPNVAFQLIEAMPENGMSVACRNTSSNGFLASLFHWIMRKKLGAKSSARIIDMVVFSVSEIVGVLDDSRSRVHLFYFLDARFSKKHVRSTSKRKRIVGASGWTFKKKVSLFVNSLLRF